MKKYLNSVEEVIKALKEGKKISIKNANCQYIMENGLICRLYSDGQKVINAEMHLTSENKFYTEEPEPLKFEVNRAYKNRAGTKMFLDKIGKEGHLYFICVDDNYWTQRNGQYRAKQESQNDIVGYWEEEK